MTKLIQYDFFEAPVSELQDMRNELKEMKVSQDKVRRAMFARHGELAKMYLELYHEFETLKRNICKGVEK